MLVMTPPARRKAEPTSNASAHNPIKSRKKVMTWSRGFFRIWLVLSVVWIGLSVYFAKPKTYFRLWQGAEYEIEFPSGHRTTFDTSKSRRELAADITEEWRREAMRNGPA